MIKLMFPAYVFEWDFLGDQQTELMSPEYFELMKNEMDAMRRRDPEGRKISNAYSGWQSNDGVDTNPIFQKMMRQIKIKVRDEIGPVLGMKDVRVDLHNAWANINDHTSWNKPHLHNGCMFSGALYIHADGDEGDFIAIDTDYKFAGNIPREQCVIQEHESFQPRTGRLIMFPSALMHMVEPNPTHKDRYSISFNCDFDGASNHEENHNRNIYFEMADEHGNLRIKD